MPFKRAVSGLHGMFLVAVFGCTDEARHADPPSELLAFDALFQIEMSLELADVPEDPVAAPADLVILTRGYAVVDALQADIKIFDSAGAFVRVTGRPGDGPGEFKMPLRAVRGPSDDLIVMDAGRGAISKWDSAGRLTWEWRVPSVMYDLAYLPDEEIVVLGGRLLDVNTHRPTSNLAIHEFSLDGTLRHSYRPWPLASRQWEWSFSDPKLGVLGSTVVSGIGFEHYLHVHWRDGRVDDSLRLSTLIPVPEDMPGRPMVRLEITEWMADKAVLGRIIGVDNYTFIAQYARVGRLGAIAFQYAVADIRTGGMSVTDWTDVNILQARKPYAYGIHIGDDGTVQLRRYVMVALGTGG